MKSVCLSLVFLGLTSIASAETVKECTIASMMPYMQNTLAKFINEGMQSKRIGYESSSLTFKSLGKETWQEFPFVQPDEENAFEVTFRTEKGNLMSLVTPQDQSYGDPQLRQKLTLLIPDPVVKEVRDSEGNIVKHQCELSSHHGYNRSLFIINTSQDNFVAYDSLVSCAGCTGGYPTLALVDMTN